MKQFFSRKQPWAASLGLMALWLAAGCVPEEPQEPVKVEEPIAEPVDPDAPPEQFEPGRVYCVPAPERWRPQAPDANGPRVDEAVVRQRGGLALNATIKDAAPRDIPLTVYYQHAGKHAAAIHDVLAKPVEFELPDLGQAVLGLQTWEGHRYYTMTVSRPETLAVLRYRADRVEPTAFEQSLEEAVAVSSAKSAAASSLAKVAARFLAPAEPIYTDHFPRLLSVEALVNGENISLYPAYGSKAAPLAPDGGYVLRLPAMALHKVTLNVKVDARRIAFYLDRSAVSPPDSDPLYVELRLPMLHGPDRVLAVMTGPDGTATFRHNAEQRRCSVELSNTVAKELTVISPKSGRATEARVLIRSGRPEEVALDTGEFTLPALPDATDPSDIPKYLLADMQSVYNSDTDRFMRVGVHAGPLALAPRHIAILDALDAPNAELKRLIDRYKENQQETRRARRRRVLQQYEAMRARPAGQWTEHDAGWTARGLALDDAGDQDYSATMFMMLLELAERVQHQPLPVVGSKLAQSDERAMTLSSTSLGAHAAAAMAFLKGSRLFREAPESVRLLDLAQQQADFLLAKRLPTHLDALEESGLDADVRKDEAYVLADEPIALCGSLMQTLHGVTDHDRYREGALVVRDRLGQLFLRRHGLMPLRWEIEVTALYINNVRPFAR